MRSQFVFFTPYQPNCNVCPCAALICFPIKTSQDAKQSHEKKQDARTADVVPGDENATFTFWSHIIWQKVSWRFHRVSTPEGQKMIPIVKSKLHQLPGEHVSSLTRPCICWCCSTVVLVSLSVSCLCAPRAFISLSSWVSAKNSYTSSTLIRVHVYQKGRGREQVTHGESKAGCLDAGRWMDE